MDYWTGRKEYCCKICCSGARTLAGQLLSLTQVGATSLDHCPHITLPFLTFANAQVSHCPGAKVIDVLPYNYKLILI